MGGEDWEAGEEEAVKAASCLPWLKHRQLWKDSKDSVGYRICIVDTEVLKQKHHMISYCYVTQLSALFFKDRFGFEWQETEGQGDWIKGSSYFVNRGFKCQTSKVHIKK